MKVDAVIVGARCAGAATALLLARAGARVMLVDKGVYGSDTLSTHEQTATRAAPRCFASARMSDGPRTFCSERKETGW